MRRLPLGEPLRGSIVPLTARQTVLEQSTCTHGAASHIICRLQNAHEPSFAYRQLSCSMAACILRLPASQPALLELTSTLSPLTLATAAMCLESPVCNARLHPSLYCTCIAEQKKVVLALTKNTLHCAARALPSLDATLNSSPVQDKHASTCQAGLSLRFRAAVCKHLKGRLPLRSSGPND
jgi:hypothetical protein